MFDGDQRTNTLKDMCLIEIGLHLQIILIIPHSTMNTVEHV